jgi:hypothetical protein
MLLIAAMLLSAPSRDGMSTKGDGLASGPGSTNGSVAGGSGDGTEAGSTAGNESARKEPTNDEEPAGTESVHEAAGGDTVGPTTSGGHGDVASDAGPQVAATQGDEPPIDTSAMRLPRLEFFTLGSESDATPIATPESDVTPVQDGFSGRKAGGKEALLHAGGGTEGTEGAVKLALEWLAKNQRSDGLWSLQGPYEDGGSLENVAAATAMALIAFQGAGHTHRGDPRDEYTRVVARGSAALIDHIAEEGKSYRNGIQHGGYTQALCTIALCELYGMTNDRQLNAPVRDAVEYCIFAQSSEGGWRYTPQQDSDTSVTGWFVMALQSARMAGLKVPGQTLDSVSMYLNEAGKGYATRYSYQPGTAATPSMTAEALLCRQYLGWKRDDPRLIDGTNYLLDNLPEWEKQNVYYWYYATQVCHHMQGDMWQRWNEVMREELPRQQITEGPERGSWSPEGDRYGSAGGRLYVTCMCTYMLEVYYRHLPLYQGNAADSHP